MTQLIAKGKAEAIVAKALADPATVNGSMEGVRAVAAGEGILVCLDQIVRFEDEHREKPEVPEVARKFLRSYRAMKDESPKWIECVNGICVYFRGRYLSSFEISKVAFEYEPEGGSLSNAMIDALIAKGECLNSAGSFVIEDPLFKVQGLKGTEESITGLPVAAVRGLIRLVQMPPVQYCLFDMDGLLLNTESMYTVAQKEVCGKYGKEFTWDVKAQLMGLPAVVAAQRIVELCDLSCTPKEFLQQRDDVLIPLFRKSEFLPGARELLQELKDRLKIPRALATSSSRQLVQVKTELVREDFDSFFGQNTICGNELDGRGKPEPEIFLRAMTMLEADQKIDPATCMVFEDAPNGVEAALAAGMQVCMIPDENLSLDKRGQAHLELPLLSWVQMDQLVK